jgi:NAD(P)-dependent dehydrogenase (short-subunit alcohol dehydrogenase family)
LQETEIVEMNIIVMTGGTSGFGAVAAKQLLLSENNRLILGVHHHQIPGAEMLDLNLTSLDSVRSFASRVNELIGTARINSLILNAGISLQPPVSYTADGFEKTFAVNHLAHYLLLHLLLPSLAKQANVVITTSGTHDPAEKTIIPPPQHANANWLAYPQNDPSHDHNPRTAVGRAYSASKLCNLLTARALSKRPETLSRNINVIAFDPGATPGTGLMNNNNFVLQFIWRMLGLPVFKPFTPAMNSQTDAGNALVELATGKVHPTQSKIYAALRRKQITWPTPSELARNDGVMNCLWQDSAKLLGIPA